MRRPALSLFWRIWLSTSVALTAIFMLTGWVVQKNAAETTSQSLEDQAKISLQAYDALWKARAGMLASTSSILSSMPNVRAAFGTRDENTIRDTTRELWDRISADLKETALFLVADPYGNLVASFGSEPARTLPRSWPVVVSAEKKFPQQVSGFSVQNGELFQLVLTPVYVDSTGGPGLINVLVAGYKVNDALAQRFKQSTGGSEFLFISHGRVLASTLGRSAGRALARSLADRPQGATVSDGATEYTALVRELIDVEGRPIGQFCMLQSFEEASRHIARLRRDIVLVWLLSISAGLVLTYLLARKIVGPIRRLDRAAAEVAQQNYGYRVPVESEDELGRLAQSFNSMGSSLQAARAELIRHERISTVGRLASSIVHDLRNPLAAIYGGAETLIDTELSREQMKRLAANLYAASRRIKEMLDDLLDISRGRSGKTELCDVRDLVLAAAEAQAGALETQGVRLELEVPEGIEVVVQPGRIERVFSNLIVNSLDAMRNGGAIRIAARSEGDRALIEFEDTGPGISPEVRARLFEPFASSKRGGLGLGLALARQTVVEHGGDLSADSREGPGARFCLRLPTAMSRKASGNGATAAAR